MIKRFLIAFVLLAVVCGGLVYFNMFRNQAIQDFFANQQQPAVPVATETVEALSWQPGIEAIGTLRAVRGVDLSVEAGGVVRDVTFTSNDEVEEGELLVQIDDTIEQADLIAARSSVQLAEQTLDRAEALRTRGVSAESSLEEAQASAESARSQVERLEAVLSQKSIKAPFSGTIGIPQVESGQYVTTGTVVATLQDLDTMRVDFTVPEQQRNLVEIGQPISLGAEQDALDYNGTIIGIEPRIDPQTRLVAIRAEVGNEEEALFPGQFVRVRVELPEEPEIIALPQTSIVTSLYGDYVYVVGPAEAEDASEAEQASDAEQADSDTGSQDTETDTAAPAETDEAATADDEQGEALEVRQVFVQTGRRNGQLIEVTEGLSEGDMVVTAGQNRLSNGMPVTLDDSESPLEGNSVEQVSR
ncbi:efflux RND transporter periplasmic adaptor subunit [Pararhizobium haloflavum]|uniref:efflux RND transporter periplasmic adaptor subunit n=1 Tax=Pararhizobium haloflavum TaxID=2037914 RepID=UPI000C1792CD|nr:efflux RND transporter periplasmic adaptor subunit [Pararhizobium haloflavum]